MASVFINAASSAPNPKPTIAIFIFFIVNLFCNYFHYAIHNSPVTRKGAYIRVWGIEQNEARETFLNYYYGIDVANYMIKNTANKYITWKYWH